MSSIATFAEVAPAADLLRTLRVLRAAAGEEAPRVRLRFRSAEVSPSSERADEEADLIKRVADGDRDDALLELYRRYATPLYRLGVRLLRDTNEAEDLVQETFVRLWRGAGRYDPEQASVRSFVFLIGRRVAIDVHRRSTSRPVASGDDPVDLDRHAVDGEDDRLLRALEIREALESLSGKHREVLELGYDEDLSQAQIAERLEVPLGTVKTRTYHALRALRSEFDRRQLRV